MSSYAELAAINVNEHTEKKGGLTYLSWVWAVDQLFRADPDATWVYLDPDIYQDGTMMVYCRVRAFNKERQAQLPVMDYKNRAIAHPDAFSINTAMQRCLVKAIALHGLGLYIYAGEDLPAGEEKEEEAPAKRPNTARQVAVDALEAMSPDQQDFLRTHAAEIERRVGLKGNVIAYLEEQHFDTEEQLALWALLPSGVRSYIKTQKEMVAMNSAAKAMKDR